MCDNFSFSLLANLTNFDRWFLFYTRGRRWEREKLWFEQCNFYLDTIEPKTGKRILSYLYFQIAIPRQLFLAPTMQVETKTDVDDR